MHVKIRLYPLFVLLSFVPVFCMAVTPSFKPLFDEDLGNAIYPKEVWEIENGILSASEDQIIWSSKTYSNVVLSLEFKTESGTNSGVFVYGSDMGNWITDSVEIQITDDYSEQWSSAAKTWQCAAIFGRKPAFQRRVHQPGEWNHMTIVCTGPVITVFLNEMLVNLIDMRNFTNAKINPDGSSVPPWLSKPLAALPLSGHIGFQGKHAGAPIYFKNIQVLELHP